MKSLIAVSFALALTPALGHTLKLEQFDQFKLGELVGNLPTTVREKTVSSLGGPGNGFVIRSVFPKHKAPFEMACKSSYYNGSPYPSYTSCDVTVDLNDPALDSKYDQHRFVFTDPTVVTALREAIPYGRVKKQFNSFERNRGTTYEGRYTNIFHYIFTCQRTACVLKLSSKI